MRSAWGAPSYPPGAEWDVPVTVVREVPDDAEQVVCATGFLRGFEHDPLLRRVAREQELDVAGRWLVLDDDATIPKLTGATRTVAVSGVHAQWAFPAADTLMGAKYAARRFLRHVCRTR